jgi:hypothetical protein
MENSLKAVYKWQSDAGNLDKPYSDFLQSSFQVEEALEGFDLTELAYLVGAESTSAKDVSRAIIERAMQNGTLQSETILPDVERFDKHVDSIIFNIGSLGALGLDIHQINRGILAVNHANKQKLNAKRDSKGKLGKPTNFVPPEAELEKILSERS